MSRSFKKLERHLLVVLLIATAGTTIAAVLSFIPCVNLWSATTSDLFATAGLLAALSGFVQIDVTDFFTKVLERYSDDDKFPFGPPSHVTREIIDNPDKPVSTEIRNRLFMRPGIGFWIVIYGTALQIVALWV